MANQDRLRNALPGDLISQVFARPGLFDRLFDLPGAGVETPSAFPVDILELDDCYRIVADLPGFGKDEIGIGIENNVLTISAQRATAEDDGGRHTRRERAIGGVTRSFHLPGHIDAAGIQANLERGVLDLRLPKLVAAAKRKIEIR